MKNPNSKSLLKWLSLSALVSMLVAAVFVGGQYVTQRLSAPDSRNFIVAQELPLWTPDALGLFVRREDNSIFMGTGGINTDAGTDGSPVFSYDGPVVEVVIHNQTILYEDVTAFPGPFSLSDIHQKVAAGTIDEIDATRRLTVWGRNVGDRIIADTLLYADLALSFVDGRSPQIKSLYDK